MTENQAIIEDQGTSTSSLLKEVALKVMMRRRELKMHQTVLAEKAGVSVPLLSLLERGIANINLGKLKQITDVLGLELIIDVK